MNITRYRMAGVLALAALGAGTAVLAPVRANANKASSQSTVQAISARDKQLGAQAHPELLAEFGGAMTGAQARYVEGVGKGIAVQSGLSNARDDFTVTLLNSSVNNAFAVPGGYVYVTRQLVALMNNEAELAGVLGHEVGHVAARHAKRRQSAATQNALLGVLGQVLLGATLGNSAIGQIGQKVVSQGSQMLTLRFSRSQEIEADNLGIAYLRNAGYDARAMATVLQSLASQNALDARLMGSTDRVPEWASTHPDPASRVRAALTRAGSASTGKLDADRFLSGIDGLTYGDDPRQGIVDGRKFTHPELRLAFEAPSGFFLVNGTRAVTIQGQSGRGEFTTAAYSGDLDAYVRSAFATLTGKGQPTVAPQSVTRTTINGLSAAWGGARVQTQSGQVDVVVYAYEFARDQAFHFMTISQAGSSGTFAPMFNSVRRITVSEAGDVRPRKLAVVTVRTGDTVQSLAARMAYTDAPLERFLVLNGLRS
ncbi:MAG TPA: M48 family metalloprotease, partial [Novosphingobium sp.]|nr:M48 family metalloprotease [Novosphingobium sp.]